ncbi:MAG TPA: dynamin family protein, partial [Planococcus sp. (in: firmicutes)]|nr:dynamin family protein [Planococcus sp. (in: firmicutes)]
KTQEERNARKEEVVKRLNETASTQIENHLKKLMKSSLKDARILTDEESLKVDEMKFEIPFSVVESQISKGAVLSRDAVLNFANNVSIAVQKWFIAKTESWKLAQEEKFAGMTDDTVNEMGMKAQLLDQKMLAIRTLEEMDVRIKKVEQAFLAMMPTQKSLAEEQLSKWQEKFQQSRENMIDFTPDMLEQETVNTETEMSPMEAAESSSFDEQVVLERVNRTFDAIKSIRGFTETAQYIKRKASRLENQEFTIALFGAFSAGKSSFSNALMGESVLPVSPNPTTATINRIRPVAADKPHETADVRMKTVEQLTDDLRSSFRIMGTEIADLEDAYRKSASLAAEVEIEQQVHKSFITAFREGYPSFKDSLGQVIRTNREEFSLFVAKEERSCFVDEIDFYFDCSLTRSGVTLVDTPGADSINARHTNVAFEYIRNADAVLFITYYNHAFARADREFLIQLGRVKDAFEMDKMFFVVNAIDLAHDQEEQQAVENYVQDELQRFGIRFPRLYGVSSLLALQDPENSGMPKFEEDFQHFLKDELKGMAVQSLAEEEQKAVDRFRGLIEQTELNLLRKDERLEELNRIEQQVRILFENSAARILSKEASQEVEELLYYVRQRVFYRFNDFFKEAFNPSVFANKPAQKALENALEDIKQMTGFDFEQEMRVTNLRLARFIEKKVENRFKEDTAKLKEMNPEFSFSPYELEESDPLTMHAPFGSADYSSVKSHYKNNRSFFEKNEKEKLRDALKSLMDPDAKQYLDHEKQRLKEWADFWIEQEAEGLRLYLIRQTTEQIDSERTLLLEHERLNEWKALLAKLSEERV